MLETFSTPLHHKSAIQHRENPIMLCQHGRMLVRTFVPSTMALPPPRITAEALAAAWHPSALPGPKHAHSLKQAAHDGLDTPDPVSHAIT